MASDSSAVKQKAAAKLRPQTFKPGQSGNPNGRPLKKHTTTSLLSELLEGDPAQVLAGWESEGLTGAMKVAQILFAKMQRGDLTAIKEGLDRVEGRVPLPMQSQVSGRVIIEFVKADAKPLS